jgi:hypothetical protein
MVDKHNFCKARKEIIMLRQANEFKTFKLRARDGDIGNAKEFYFDDQYWTVRYLVADTGGWLSSRRVLISPYALNPANEAERVLPVDLTKKQIQESPSLDSDKPVSRQYEMQYYDYYGWPYYGYGPHLWGATPYIVRDPKAWKETARREEAWDPNLRSTNDVTSHHIQALDGEIGHVEDFIIDDETWSIRYLVVDTKNWWAGKHVLVSPQWIERVSWAESKVFVNLSHETIKRSPEYTQESLNRDYEIKLHRHYDRNGYWAAEPAAKGR